MNSGTDVHEVPGCRQGDEGDWDRGPGLDGRPGTRLAPAAGGGDTLVLDGFQLAVVEGDAGAASHVAHGDEQPDFVFPA